MTTKSVKVKVTTSKTGKTTVAAKPSARRPVNKKIADRKAATKPRVVPRAKATSVPAKTKKKA